MILAQGDRRAFLRGRRAKCSIVAPEINKGARSGHSTAARRDYPRFIALHFDDLTEIIVSKVANNRREFDLKMCGGNIGIFVLISVIEMSDGL